MRLLVTAGPTREYFDTVRFISNASTGRMGYAIAEAARVRGHDVVLISGPVSIPAPAVEVIQVTSADEMLDAACRAFEGCDAAVMAAAVSDWKPAERSDHKAPKRTLRHCVELEPTPDVCATLGERKGHRVVVGFAVEDRDARGSAESKMARKQCDAIILNHPETIGDASARIEIKSPGVPWVELRRQPKERVGEAIVELVERLVRRRAVD